MAQYEPDFVIDIDGARGFNCADKCLWRSALLGQVAEKTGYSAVAKVQYFI